MAQVVAVSGLACLIWGIELVRDVRSASAAVVMASAFAGWAFGRVRLSHLAAIRSRLRTAVRASFAELESPDLPGLRVDPAQVKAALQRLNSPTGSGRSPVGRRPVTPDSSGTHDLGQKLADVILDLAKSTRPRDAEAGRLLLDYYLKRVGSQEVVMERLHLSRPTFYRRLRRGLEVVAERLNEANFAEEADLLPAGSRFVNQRASLVG